MKKLLSALASALMILSLTACKNTSEGYKDVQLSELSDELSFMPSTLGALERLCTDKFPLESGFEGNEALILKCYPLFESKERVVSAGDDFLTACSEAQGNENTRLVIKGNVEVDFSACDKAWYNGIFEHSGLLSCGSIEITDGARLTLLNGGELSETIRIFGKSGAFIVESGGALVVKDTALHSAHGVALVVKDTALHSAHGVAVVENGGELRLESGTLEVLSLCNYGTVELSKTSESVPQLLTDGSFYNLSTGIINNSCGSMTTNFYSSFVFTIDKYLKPDSENALANYPSGYNSGAVNITGTGCVDINGGSACDLTTTIPMVNLGTISMELDVRSEYDCFNFKFSRFQNIGTMKIRGNANGKMVVNCFDSCFENYGTIDAEVSDGCAINIQESFFVSYDISTLKYTDSESSVLFDKFPTGTYMFFDVPSALTDG